MKNRNGNTENLQLFNEQGVKIYSFETDSTGYSTEIIYDSMGNQLTLKDSSGYSYEKTYNENGNQLTYKNSNGLIIERTFDSNGKQLTYKNNQ